MKLSSLFTKSIEETAASEAPVVMIELSAEDLLAAAGGTGHKNCTTQCVGGGTADVCVTVCK